MLKKRAFLLLAIFIIASANGDSKSFNIKYPQIQSLSLKDAVFKQLQDALSQSYAAEKDAGQYPDLFFCTWTLKYDEDIFSLAARFSIPYETLATLNGFARSGIIKAGEQIIIPSIHGLFIPSSPRNDLDILLASRKISADTICTELSVFKKGVEQKFTFLVSQRLYKTERTFFLDVGFRMPLDKGILTSGYGFRQSPIDGHDRMHNGVDIAAPYGSPVLASRDGQVIASGWDDVLGLYIVLDHGAGMTSIYGHLSHVAIMLNEKVKSGTIIGRVGSTGLSTGPHLHFEIRLSGKPKDPSQYLRGIKP